jgi:hypothetical protein
LNVLKTAIAACDNGVQAVIRSQVALHEQLDTLQSSMFLSLFLFLGLVTPFEERRSGKM